VRRNENEHKTALALLLLLAGYALPASAIVVEISITGEVSSNQIASGPLSSAVNGDAAMLNFRVDSNTFVNSASFPTRGYEIIPSSFSFTAGSGSVGIANPYPSGTPYFVLRNDDPAVDGFFTGTNINGFPNGVATDSPGISGPLTPVFSTSYSNNPLTSLDILAAMGTYNFTGLSAFTFVVRDLATDVMEIDFAQMTIQAVPVPAAAWLFGSGLLGLIGMARRKKA